jgi:glycosyltransferase involved in cell wall biosynthesis
MGEALVKRGHEVHVVTYHLGRSAPDPPLIIHRTPNVRTYQKVTPGPTYQKLLIMDTFLTLKLKEVLGKYAIDLVHAHHYESLIAALLATRRTDHHVIYDAHTLLQSELPYYRLGIPTRVKQSVGTFLDRNLPGRASHVIATSAKIKKTLIDQVRLPAKNVTEIVGGVEVDHFFTYSHQRTIRSNAQRTLVYTGNLAPYQGIDLMLGALKEITSYRQDVRLLIVTDESFRPYEKLARRLGVQEDIELTDVDYESLPAILAKADVALNPRTECDGYPQKLLNYMAAGKASVSFAGSAGNMENGRHGLVVPNDDVTAFAEAVLQLVDDRDLARVMGFEARDHVAAKYSWQAVAMKTEAVYNRVLRTTDGL